MSFDLSDWVLLAISPFIGSFVGVVVLRLPKGEPVIVSRSRCPHCRNTLKTPDLIPLFSWLWLKGRCRYCQMPLGVFYPGIELAAVGVALWAVLVTEGVVTPLSAVLGWWLLALAVIDARELVLPDELTLPLIPLSLGAIWWLNPDQIVQALVGMVGGFLGLWGIAVLYRKLRGREGLGFGDVKLMAAAGGWVGVSGLPSVVLWGSVSALLYFLGRWLLDKAISRYTKLPFGTFLALGLWLTWLYGPVLLSPA